MLEETLYSGDLVIPSTSINIWICDTPYLPRSLPETADNNFSTKRKQLYATGRRAWSKARPAQPPSEASQEGYGMLYRLGAFLLHFNCLPSLTKLWTWSRWLALPQPPTTICAIIVRCFTATLVACIWLPTVCAMGTKHNLGSHLLSLFSPP